MAQQSKSQGGGNRMFLIVAGLIVVAGVAWLLLARGGGIGQSAALPTPAEFEALSATVEADPSVGIALGEEDAPVEIVEFFDYSCPHCANFAGFAGKLLRQNYVETGGPETGGGPVRWVIYDYVLGSFPNSVPAHMAARCAGEQGRYWPMHDLIFARQTRWYTGSAPEDELAEIAEEVGLDMGAYRECMSEGRYLEEIAAARALGSQRGVNSTPTIFIDGQRIDLTGREPYTYIEGLIQQRLEEQPAGEVRPDDAATGS